MTVAPYILPSHTVPVPRQMTLTQYLQQIFVGITGLDGTLVRPKWQPEPPKQPDLDVNWLAIGIDESIPDANSYLGTNDDDTTDSQRHETLVIGCSIYGPDDLDTYGLLRDGFQIEPNRRALNAASMGFVEITRALRVPELVNGRFIDRLTTVVTIRRQVRRTYGVLTLVSASGVIYVSPGADILTVSFGVPAP